MLERLRAFRKSRRSAVAMVFALSFIPLIYLVGLSVDYTFFSLANNQALLAAQGAATNAVRAAVSTYTLETNAGVSGSPTATPSAYNDGVTAGQQAGYMWFLAQLGQLPRGAISYTGTSTSGQTATAIGYPSVTIAEPTTGGGYTATVTYSLTYPPLFNGLFKRVSNWVVSGNTQATSNFDYAEILFLLDSSNSMLIGTDTNDINAMQYNTVCQPSTTTSLTVLDANNIATGEGLLANDAGGYDPGTVSNGGASDNDTVNFSDVTNYTASSSTDTNGSCTKNNSPPYFKAPMTPCALACHNSSVVASASNGGYFEDFYGLARRLRASELAGNAPYTGGPTNLTNSDPYSSNAALSLRLDIVMDSANLAISEMVTDEAFSGQFTAGVYTFTTDVSAIATGTSATATNPTSTPEATSLTAAAAAVTADDYIQTPTETSFPPVYASGTRNTDFATSMANLLNGKNSSNASVTGGGTAISAVSTATEGQTASNPLKFLFIVTDGLDDLPQSSPHEFGEMTSYTNETAGNSSAVCQPYKNKGFTIYVLAIKYYPLASTNYYNQIQDEPTTYTTTDYPTQFPYVANWSGTSQITSVQDLVTTDLTSNVSTPSNPNALPPVQLALQACASSSSDFYTSAGGASSIKEAIDEMLRSALASTIRLSN